MRNIITVQRYETPCGVLILGAHESALCLCDWKGERDRTPVCDRLKRYLNADFSQGSSQVIATAAGQLDEYFAATRREFDIPILFAGSDFQKMVWRELHRIPYGTTISYGELARRIGMPSAVRAVARAVGANALSVFAPCHRIVGADRSLTGYAGGLAAKKYLIDLENTPTDA